MDDKLMVTRSIISSRYKCYVIFLYIILNLLSTGAHGHTSSTDDQYGPRAVDSLKFVSVVSRHGNRGLLHSFPKNPYPKEDRNFWPNGPAKLTNKGKVQMYNLGTKIRQLYNGFLSEHYFSEEFKAYSTLVDRTLMSAQLFLAGLFPPKSFQIWHMQLPWQPVPVFPNYFDHTKYNDNAEACPRFAEDQAKTSFKFEEDNKSNLTAFFESLQPNTGLFVPEGSFIVGIKSLWDSLMCADSEGLPLPEWANTVYPEPLATYSYEAHVARSTATDTMTRLLEGQFFQEILEAMQAKMSDSKKPRMYYYSGHDVTFLGFQAILGLQNTTSHLVKTGSALIFELHQDLPSSLYFVKVLMIDGGSVDLEPNQLTLPNCEGPCFFYELKNVTRKFVNIYDYDKECRTLQQQQ